MPFGPYNAAILIAVRLRDPKKSGGKKVCTLGFAEHGKVPKWEKKVFQEDATTVFRLAAHHSCEVRIEHHDGDYNLVIEHCGKVHAKTSRATSKVYDDPPPPPPTQVCLCGDESRTCEIDETPDCNNSAVCVPLGFVVKQKK